MRKALLLAVAVAAALAAFAYVQFEQRKAFENCKLTLVDVRVGELGLASAKLTLVIDIYNPGSITATLDRAEFDVYADGTYLGHGTIPQRVDIPPNATRRISVPFEASYAGVLSVLKGQRTWTIKGTAYIDTPFGAIAVPFEVKK